MLRTPGLPTLGGLQLWADVAWRCGWRVQELPGGGRGRLLDPSGRARAFGPPRELLAELDRRVPRAAARGSRPLVVFLHGMGRTRVSFAGLARALTDDGFACARLTYPSTRRSVAEHADWLEGLMERFADEGVAPRVHFVTHSLGAVVLRASLGRGAAWRERLPVGRAVLLGPPNQGSRLAERLHRLAPYRWLYGATGQDLVPERVRPLPALDLPTRVVAGARGDGRGWNPFLPGDDDGIVALDETPLDGAEHHVVRGLHAFLASVAPAVALTRDFLASERPHRVRPVLRAASAERTAPLPRSGSATPGPRPRP